MLAVSVVISVVALVVSVVFAIRQARVDMRQAEITNAQPLVVDLFREFRDTAHRRHQLKNLPDVGDPAPDGFASITDEELRNTAMETSWLYGNIGVMVAHGMVDAAAIAGWVGNSAIDLWKELGPFVRGERLKRAHGYYEDYFEYLVRVRFERDLRPDDVRRRAMPKLYEIRSL